MSIGICTLEKQYDKKKGSVIMLMENFYFTNGELTGNLPFNSIRKAVLFLIELLKTETIQTDYYQFIIFQTDVNNNRFTVANIDLSYLKS